VRQCDQASDQIGAAAGHPHVGDHQGRALFASGRHGLVARRRLTYDAEVGLLLQQGGQCRADAGVVVRDGDGDLTAGRDPHAEQGRPRCIDLS
jgi:hypothetical protein